MNTISDRFQQALDFVVCYGYADSEAKVAEKLDIMPSTITMAKRRGPSWDLLLNFCDHYPISFWWLRSGEGDMIGNGDREVALLQKIAQLESRIAELEKK